MVACCRVLGVGLLGAMSCGDPRQAEEFEPWAPIRAGGDAGIIAADAAPSPVDATRDVSHATDGDDVADGGVPAAAAAARMPLAPLAGRWEGTVQGPKGPQAFALVFSERGLFSVQSGKDSFADVTHAGQVFQFVPEGGGVKMTTVEQFAMPVPGRVELVIRYSFEKVDSWGGATQNYSRETLTCALTSAGLAMELQVELLNGFGTSSGSVRKGDPGDVPRHAPENTLTGYGDLPATNA